MFAGGFTGLSLTFEIYAMINLASKENSIRILYGVYIKHNVYVLQLGSGFELLGG